MHTSGDGAKLGYVALGHVHRHPEPVARSPFHIELLRRYTGRRGGYGGAIGTRP